MSGPVDDGARTSTATAAPRSPPPHAASTPSALTTLQHLQQPHAGISLQMPLSMSISGDSDTSNKTNHTSSTTNGGLDSSNTNFANSNPAVSAIPQHLQPQMQFLPVPVTVPAIPVQNGYLVPAATMPVAPVIVPSIQSQIPIVYQIHQVQQSQPQMQSRIQVQTASVPASVAMPQKQVSTQKPQDVRPNVPQSDLQSHFQPDEKKMKNMPPSGPACYCGVSRETSPFAPPFQCRKCYRLFHQDCIETLKSWKAQPLPGDDFYVFICKACTPHKTEQIMRQALTFLDIIHLTLFLFTHAHDGAAAQVSAASLRVVWSRDAVDKPPQPRLGPSDGRAYFAKRQVAAFVDANWERFWLKERAKTWTHSLMGSFAAGCGSNNSGGTGAGGEELRFVSGKDQFAGDNSANSLIALFNPMVYPSMIESKRSRMAAYDISPVGALLELPGTALRQVQTVSTTGSASVQGAISGAHPTAPKKKRLLDPTGGESDNEGPDTVNARKKPLSITKPKRVPRLLEPEKLDSTNSVCGLLYPDLNNPETGPVVLSTELTHSAPQMRISADGLTVFTDKASLQSLQRTGCMKDAGILKSHFARRRGDMPELDGRKSAVICKHLVVMIVSVILSVTRPDRSSTNLYRKKPPPPLRKEDGDVLGLMIKLPPQPDVDNLVRRIWNAESSYVQFRTKPLEKLPGSEIRYYKNGNELGMAFTELYTGKYYPAVSSYQHGTLTLNFGPKFAYAIPSGARAYSDVPRVFAWSEYAMYSYEPFRVYDREYTTAGWARIANATGGGGANADEMSNAAGAWDGAEGAGAKRKKSSKKVVTDMDVDVDVEADTKPEMNARTNLDVEVEDDLDVDIEADSEPAAIADNSLADGGGAVVR
ncbi:transcription factor, contains a PHD finger motif [Entophlyctis luteolus]|nr:transcription factor, contains a PHD finger motif [Entophlyctis luteolus]